MKRIVFSVLSLGLCAPLAAQTDSLELGLREVSVTGTRSEVTVRNLPEAITLIPRQKLMENYRSSLLPTLSEQVPGLFVTSRGLLGYGVSDGAAGGISLRGMGSGSGRVLVLIDGHPQYMGLFGHSISDSYQTMLADEVQVLRGPASVLYGSNAMGGVVNILTRKMPSDGMRNEVHLGYGSYNTLQSSFSNRIRAGRFNSVFAANYDRTDGHRDRLGFQQYGGYTKLGYNLSSHWDAYADLNLTHFLASYPGPTQAPVYDARQWITRGVTTAVLSNKYKTASGSVSFFYNWGRHKINDGHTAQAAPQTKYFRSNDQMMGVSAFQTLQLLQGNRTTFGVDYQHVGGKAKNTDIATGKVLKRLVDRQEDIWAGYADMSQELLQHFILSAGIRMDHNSRTGTEWVPKGALAWLLPHDGTLKFSVSKGFRNPNIRELYMFAPANPDLKPERLVSYEIGFSQQPLNGALQYDLTLFYLKADNLIQRVMTPSGPKNTNTGAVENMGLEAGIRYRIHPHWSLNANYSALHMNHHVVASPEHKLYVGADWKSGSWTVNGGLQYVADLFTETGQNEHRENFCLLNLTGTYHVSPAFEIYAKGENLLAQRYEINRGYPMPKATFAGGVRITF